MITAAEEADIYEQRYILGWLRAKYDGKTKGYFEPVNYPVGSAEHDGYQAFVRAVRTRSAA